MNNHLKHRIEEVIKTKRMIPVYMLMLIGLFFLGLISFMLTHWKE